MVCWWVGSGAIGCRMVRGGGVVDRVVDGVVDQLVGPYDGGDQDEERRCNQFRDHGAGWL